MLIRRVSLWFSVLLVGILALSASVSGQEDEPALSTSTRTPAPTLTPSITLTPTLTFTPSPTLTSTPTLTPTFTLTPSPTITPIGPFFYPEGVSPLTGQPYPDEAAMRR